MPSKDTQFKKGHVANPHGRPKKEYCLTDILKEQGDTKDVNTEEGKISRKQAISTKLWAMAMDGDVSCLKYLFDRIDGRPKESIDIDMDASVETTHFIVEGGEDNENT